MGNPEKNVLLGHTLNAIKQSKISIFLLVPKLSDFYTKIRQDVENRRLHE